MSARSGFGSAKRAALSRRDVDVDFATAVRQRAWVLRMSYALTPVFVLQFAILGRAVRTKSATS